MSPLLGARLSRLSLAVGRTTLAHLAVYIEAYTLDYLLYPFMLYRGGALVLSLLAPRVVAATPHSAAAGYWVGFGFMCGLSIVLNLLYLRVYDFSQTDWFGFEALKRACRQSALGNRLGPDGSMLFRYSTFVYLSVMHSPLLGVVFMREAPSPYAMTARDWRIFWLAILIANVGWTGIVTAAGSVLIALIHLWSSQPWLR